MINEVEYKVEYKEGYYYLFNQITDLINTLKDIQVQAEEIFISQEQQPIS